MKTRLLIAAVTALVLSACSGSGGGKDFQFRYATKLGTVIAPDSRQPAQNITGDLLDGGTTSLRASKGKVVLLNFWASWCIPCQVETPQLEQVYRSMHGKGVDFLGIDTKDTKGGARSFVANHNVSYPVLYDQLGESQLRLGNIPGNLPFTVLVDRQSRVAAVYLGKLTAVDLQQPLHTLLAEH
jgi:thiol-disulfide isomerase/thioredoxin